MADDIRVAILSFLDRMPRDSWIATVDIETEVGLAREQINAALRAAQQRREIIVSGDGNVALAPHLRGQFVTALPPTTVPRHLAASDAQSIADVLLVTVNEHETQALIEVFRQLTGQEAVPLPLGDRVY